MARSLTPLSDFIYDRYWRVAVDGAEHLPSGPCLIIANHSGALPLDGPLIHHALRRERPDLTEGRWLVEDQIFHAPILGTMLNRLGAVRASPQNATRLLEEGRPVIVFPEGLAGIGKPFHERYQLKRFGRGGFAKLALRTNAPIIPLAVVGAEESMPLFAKLPGELFGLPYLPVMPLGPLPLPTRWTLRFSEPITMNRSLQRPEDDLGEVRRLTERTREAIEGMLTAVLSQRPSIF